MVLALGIPDGLADALPGLRRMALQPPIARQSDADQDVVIEAEIDLVGLGRARPIAERGLELPARLAMLANKLERTPQNGVRQRHCRRIVHDSTDGPAEPCVVQRCSETAGPDLEH